MTEPAHSGQNIGFLDYGFFGKTELFKIAVYCAQAGRFPFHENHFSGAARKGL